jgi:alpha-N-acetylglucosamine transferase
MGMGHRNSTHAPYLKKVTVILTFLALFFWASTILRFWGSSDDSKPPRYAFATVLMTRNDLEFPDIEEPYLQAARLLTFQLLRNPCTRNRIDNIPFLVLVTPDIPQRHRDILSREGATVVPMESLDFSWGSSKYSDAVLAKLNLWKLEKYDKIAFLNVDSVIFRPIHDIFEDHATAMRATTNPTRKMPKSYMIAAPKDSRMNLNAQLVSGQELYQQSHMNNGLFILHPSRDLYDYYVGMRQILDQDDSVRSEQNVLDYAHREDGPMPRQNLGFGWNLKDASQYDYETGLKSISHKWWRPIADDFVGDRIAMSMDEMTAFLNH